MFGGEHAFAIRSIHAGRYKTDGSLLRTSRLPRRMLLIAVPALAGPAASALGVAAFTFDSGLWSAGASR